MERSRKVMPMAPDELRLMKISEALVEIYGDTLKVKRDGRKRLVVEVV